MLVRIDRKKFIQIPKIQKEFKKFVICNLNVMQGQWDATKEYFGHKCVYCNSSIEELTRDHIVPKSHFSHQNDTEFYNIVPACSNCNSQKDNKSLFEFLFTGKLKG